MQTRFVFVVFVAAVCTVVTLTAFHGFVTEQFLVVVRRLFEGGAPSVDDLFSSCCFIFNCSGSESEIIFFRR